MSLAMDGFLQGVPQGDFGEGDAWGRDSVSATQCLLLPLLVTGGMSWSRHATALESQFPYL